VLIISRAVKFNNYRNQLLAKISDNSNMAMLSILADYKPCRNCISDFVSQSAKWMVVKNIHFHFACLDLMLEYLR